MKWVSLLSTKPTQYIWLCLSCLPQEDHTIESLTPWVCCPPPVGALVCSLPPFPQSSSSPYLNHKYCGLVFVGWPRCPNFPRQSVPKECWTLHPGRLITSSIQGHSCPIRLVFLFPFSPSYGCLCQWVCLVSVNTSEWLCHCQWGRVTLVDCCSVGSMCLDTSLPSVPVHVECPSAGPD